MASRSAKSFKDRGYPVPGVQSKHDRARVLSSGWLRAKGPLSRGLMQVGVQTRMVVRLDLV